MITEIDTKIKEYENYIQEHITNVNIVWDKIQDYLTGDYFIDDYEYSQINDLIKTHDSSKKTTIEFNAYRQWFYPCIDENKNYDSFLLAWNHHQKANPHHWEYWTINTNKGYTALNIPFKYIIEMLCDWTAMSIKFGGEPSKFSNAMMVDSCNNILSFLLL